MPQRLAAISFLVRDHDAWLSRGVKLIRPAREEPYGRVAVFEDLYGNTFDLIGPPKR